MNIIAWLQAIDATLFRFVNHSLANPVFDWLMPKLAANRLLVPYLLMTGVLLLLKGGRRGRVFVVSLALAIGLTDGLVCSAIKHAVSRPRPCIALADTRCLIGRSGSGSLPSSHAANWFAATMVCLIFYRGSWRLMAPAAATIAFARIYDGVHYPSDVLAGAILGAGCAGATVWCADDLWRRIGQKWFPLWWQNMPSVLKPDAKTEFDPAGLVHEPGSSRREEAACSLMEANGQNLPTSAPAGPMVSKHTQEQQKASPGPGARKSELDCQWVRLGYVWIGALLLVRLGYIASAIIELSNDEAYQWLWSKHLALSYYSKPPGIALIQFCGTHLWGDTQFGVRFFSPVFAAILSLVMLRFMAREVGARQGFLLLLIITSAPLMSVGTVLMTIDPPLVVCWTLAMIAGWRAVQPDGTTKQWLLAGLAAGLGFLCKYSALYLIGCWAVFFLVWAPARVHLRKPGPYLALLVLALCALPVVIWNSGHGWITLRHVADSAGLASTWHPTLRFFGEFFFVESALLNPVFFLGALWAMAVFWRCWRERPLELYLFCMGGVVFLGHLAYSLHSRVLPNWIAPGVLPMYCLMVSYWDRRWREGLSHVKGWLIGGLVFGLAAVILLHDTDIIGRIVGRRLPGDVDPLRRVRGYEQTAAYVEGTRRKLAQEGKPVFIICDHYGITGLFTFYLSQARAAMATKPLVYYRTSQTPDNQLYFWPEYRYSDWRKGENAIYVTEPGSCKLEKDWPWRWLTGREVRFAKVPPPVPAPPVLLKEFESVTDLGLQEIQVEGRVMKRVQLFECRHLR